MSGGKGGGNGRKIKGFEERGKMAGCRKTEQSALKRLHGMVFPHTGA